MAAIIKGKATIWYAPTASRRYLTKAGALAGEAVALAKEQYDREVDHNPGEKMQAEAWDALVNEKLAEVLAETALLPKPPKPIKEQLSLF